MDHAFAPFTAPRADLVLDRAAGTLLAAACGDALGVPYEFAHTLGAHETPQMKGGGLGPYAPGEYSDDTQMAVCIAQVLADGATDTADPAVLDRIAENFLTWIAEGASDRGAQTNKILGAAGPLRGRPGSAAAMAKAARALTDNGAPSAGNGSLMRTGPVGLIALDDAEATARAAEVVSALTHADLLAIEACVIWCEGIRHAVLTGTFDGVRNGLALIPTERRGQWSAWLDEAEANPPHAFTPNGFVVRALQAAWSAITRTPVPADDPARGVFAADHLRLALEAAVRAGNDTDTVAAIAGALLGARWGASAVPWNFQRAVHGWPGLHSRDLVALGVRIASAGSPDPTGWPTAERHPRLAESPAPMAVVHPHDDGVLLGNLRLADRWAGDVDAVVSLCRTGTCDFAEVGRRDHVQVWLVDQSGGNAHPHFAVDQAARAVAGLRAEGRRVLVHCAAGRSRTPAVAARYSTLLGHSPDRALADVMGALAANRPLINAGLDRTVFELAGEPAPPSADLTGTTRPVRENQGANPAGSAGE
ncbi:ADP-ribosylglycohydrolase family protein [Nocardiopsis trehalosi]|uniref:ADP-ribosylglycohydrolase family protein n=1 Tax=Nocardiopsis trehalosi TaxID=109329 RepID=UPI000A03C30F